MSEYIRDYDTSDEANCPDWFQRGKNRKLLLAIAMVATSAFFIFICWAIMASAPDMAIPNPPIGWALLGSGIGACLYATFARVVFQLWWMDEED